MKTHLTALLRASVVSSALLVATVAVAGASSTDRAAQLLDQNGVIIVESAGPYVGPGTFRIQVSTTLGRPDIVLSDGTWLYRNRQIAGSGARGTLVVRFERGRVSELALATPTIVAALRANPHRPLSSTLLAAK